MLDHALRGRTRYPGMVNEKLELFSPLNYSNCVLWADTTKINGLSDGDKVSQWDDQSGNANHLTQANATYKPTYKTAIQNGNPAILFGTAAGVKLTSPAFNLDIYTLYLVIKTLTKVVSAPVIMEHDAVNTGILIQYEAAQFTHRYVVGAGDCASPTLANNTAYYFSLWASTTYLHTRNRSRLEAVRSNVSGASTRSKTISIGESSANAHRFSGYLMELIFYNSVHSSAEIEQFENYLSQKWDI